MNTHHNDKLPEFCYAVTSYDGKLVRIHRNVSGYYPEENDAGSREENQALADKLNEMLGVTKAQAAAMYNGSLCGWDTPGADPDMYDEAGNIRKPSDPVKSGEETAPIYTLDAASHIIEFFEDILGKHGIKVPSPEDDQREEENDAVFYGSVYGELSDQIEAFLVELLERRTTADVVSGIYSGN